MKYRPREAPPNQIRETALIPWSERRPDAPEDRPARPEGQPARPRKPGGVKPRGGRPPKGR